MRYPDILIELSATIARGTDLYNLVPVTLVNIGDVVAMDVRVDPVESGVWLGAGDIVDPILYNTMLVFAPVPSLESKARIPVSPRINCQCLAEKMIEEDGAAVLGLWWLLDCAINHRSYEDNLQKKPYSFDGRYAPLDVPLRVTYWDRQKKRRWECIESLHYDPRATLAEIRSHGVPRIVPPPSSKRQR